MNVSAEGGGEKPHRAVTSKGLQALRGTSKSAMLKVTDQPEGVTMEILSTEDVVSVTLFTLKISESEIQAYESCIAYALDHLTSKEIETFTGHTRNELEDVHQELLAAILAHCPKQFLPERYKA